MSGKKASGASSTKRSRSSKSDDGDFEPEPSASDLEEIPPPPPKKQRVAHSNGRYISPVPQTPPVKEAIASKDRKAKESKRTQKLTPSNSPKKETSTKKPVSSAAKGVIDLEGVVSFKMVRRKGTGFPRFKEGTVYIEVAKSDDEYIYAFEKHILARASSWFAETLNTHVEELSDKVAERGKKRSGYDTRYNLVYSKRDDLWTLGRARFTNYNETISCSLVEQSADPKQDIGTSKPSQPPAIKMIPAIEPSETRPVVEISSTLQSSTFQQVNGSNIIASDTTNTAALYDPASPPETVLVSNPLGAESLGESRQNATEIMTIEHEARKPEGGNKSPPAVEEEDFEAKQESDGKPVTADKKSDSAAFDNGIEKQVDHQPLASNQKSESFIPENVVENETEHQSKDKLITTDKRSETARIENGIGNQVSAVPLPNIIQKSESSVEENIVEAQKISTYELVKPIEKLESPEPTTTDCGVPFEVCGVYNNLFLMMHQETPNIDADDTDAALEHIELLIRTANYYYCLELIRPYLRDHLLSFGKPLYKAILKDPPRWLKISIVLESALIFQEAIVHIVGESSYWPGLPVTWSDFPESVMGLISSKADKLRDLQQTIDRKLTLSGITIDRLPVPIQKQTFETWLVEGYWRDWFIQALGRVDGARKRGEKNVDGAMYRLMAKGGDAYVPIDFLFAKVKGLGHKIHWEEWDWQEAANDLNLLTDYAQELVKPLCVNHSMLDLDEEGIEYLTCTKVESDEFPWMDQGDD